MIHGEEYVSGLHLHHSATCYMPCIAGGTSTSGRSYDVPVYDVPGTVPTSDQARYHGTLMIHGTPVTAR